MMRYVKKHHHHKVFATALTLSVILSLVFTGYNPQTAQAATYTFTQTNWGGGPALSGVEEATSSAAAHPGNQKWNLA